MVEQHAATAGHSDLDFAEHEKTYRMFLGFVKYGTISVVLIVILLAILTL
ncbi:MAG: aa3-type cytochrome c oxidase subunit IV [Methylovirgula sp.]